MLAEVIRWSFITKQWSLIQTDLIQHVALTFIAVGIGLGLSVPLALLAWRYPISRGPLVGFSSLLYIIPSVALFSIIGAYTGYEASYLTGEIALVGYTLLILVWNTLAGLAAVPADAREASVALGYSKTATLWRVELPLALPYIFAGLRVATSTVVGLVTVTALIGLGGLGQLITYGFNADYYTPIIVALVFSILLAGLCDLAWVGVERLLVPWSRASKRAAARA
ncbi:MAG TPA: ABC transporter permease subunit [Acidimicrobiales bacterium]|jgi:osmoprotectant transport system permease protein|nr:ABC transporter permease subunit [Acidimicrobiales bacterium]